MGLMSKLKNILFEEEEVEIPVLEKKEKKSETYSKELPKKEDKTPIFESKFYDEEEAIKVDTAIKEEVKNENINKEEVSEREIFKSEKTFNFPAFDEEEFKNFNPKPRETNILEREKRKKEYVPEKKVEVEEKKFHPSPIISPVYGILDKNYTPDEITNRETKEFSRKLDVDDVRKKAFGFNEDKDIPKKVLEKTEDDLILEEKLEKAKTIDELLKESSDEVIDLNEEMEEADTLELTQEINDLDLDDLDIKQEKEEEVSKIDDKEAILEDDNTESDLFDLIDSMYENREDGE